MPINRLFKRRPAFDYDKSRTCVSCGNEFAGRFCNICGEKVIEPHERSLKEFVGDIWSSFTFVDSKLIYSLKNILLNPGKMSLDISSGKRVFYIKPIALFLIGNLIYFLFPFFETFNTKLGSQRHFPYAKLIGIEERIESKMADYGVSLEEFENIYNNKSATVSKTVLIIVIPIFSVFVALTLWFKRRVYFDHVLFSIEFFTFTIFYNVIVLSVIAMIALNVLPNSIRTILFDDNVLTVLIILFSMYFMYGACNRLYGLKKLQSAALTIPLSFGAALSVMIYRLLLFEMVMFTL